MTQQPYLSEKYFLTRHEKKVSVTQADNDRPGLQFQPSENLSEDSFFQVSSVHLSLNFPEPQESSNEVAVEWDLVDTNPTTNIFCGKLKHF